jgi:hypothetical protein
MAHRKDPESTRCTFIIEAAERHLFEAGSPGDRIEIYEQGGSGRTGFFVTARILSVDRIPPRSPPHPRGDVVN